MFEAIPRTANPAGSPKITDVESETHEGVGDTQDSTFTRETFFSDLKKVVKKLPPDHPSRFGSQKR
jgi:hypothetical protein